MEQQIQSLIDSIRKEGIDKARSESDKIIEDAKKSAEKIISDAKAEAEKIISDADASAARLQASAEEAIRQSARNASLALKKDIEDKITALLRSDCRKALSLPDLCTIIRAAISEDVTGTAIEVPKEVFDELGDSLRSEFASEIEKGMEIRAASITGGFRIAAKDGSGYVDYSDDECTRLILPYLSDKLKEIL